MKVQFKCGHLPTTRTPRSESSNRSDHENKMGTFGVFFSPLSPIHSPTSTASTASTASTISTISTASTIATENAFDRLSNYTSFDTEYGGFLPFRTQVEEKVDLCTRPLSIPQAKQTIFSNHRELVRRQQTIPQAKETYKYWGQRKNRAFTNFHEETDGKIWDEVEEKVDQDGESMMFSMDA